MADITDYSNDVSDDSSTKGLKGTFRSWIRIVPRDAASLSSVTVVLILTRFLNLGLIEIN